MGFVRSFKWANGYGRKQCRTLFWRTRAAVKRAVKNGRKQKLKFEYDPFSYALNFNDGFSKFEEQDHESNNLQFQMPTDVIMSQAAILVFVVWVKYI